MNKILVATDFTPAAKNALDLACMIAQLSEDTVTLFHVINSSTNALLKKAGKEREDLDSYMEEISKFASEQFGVKCEYKTQEGSIFSDINELAESPDYRFILMGTHGVHGIRQNLFGADILKISRTAPVPVLAVPDEASLNNFFEKIVFPFGGHQNFDKKVKATAFLAELFGSEIHLYSVDREGMPISKETKENIAKAREYFSANGITHTSVEEKMEDFSIGFAHQTMRYAQSIDAKIIAVMASASVQYAFISDVDKEALINNQEGIGVLLTAE